MKFNISLLNEQNRKVFLWSYLKYDKVDYNVIHDHKTLILRSLKDCEKIFVEDHVKMSGWTICKWITADMEDNYRDFN